MRVAPWPPTRRVASQCRGLCGGGRRSCASTDSRCRTIERHPRDTVTVGQKGKTSHRMRIAASRGLRQGAPQDWRAADHPTGQSGTVFGATTRDDSPDRRVSMYGLRFARSLTRSRIFRQEETGVEEVDCVVVGAGVVGLAVARALAMAGREVIILDAAEGIGTRRHPATAR